jgi:hypothetical protein
MDDQVASCMILCKFSLPELLKDCGLVERSDLSVVMRPDLVASHIGKCTA